MDESEKRYPLHITDADGNHLRIENRGGALIFEGDLTLDKAVELMWQSAVSQPMQFREGFAAFLGMLREAAHDPH